MTRKLLSLSILVASIAAAAVAQARFDDVVRNLRNPDPQARMNALEMLREAKHLEAVAPIAPLVVDPVDAIQLAAIETELSFYLVDDVSARRRIAFIVEVRSSGKAETAFESGPLAIWPHAVPAELLTNLLKAVDDDHPKVRMEAIYTFGAIARAPLSDDLVKGVIAALDHYDPAVRHAAARVAGRLQVKAAEAMLVKGVGDSQEPVRFASMRALGEIGAPAAIPLLTQQVEHYRNGEGAWSAIEALARIGHESSVPLFVSRLADRDQFIRRAAAEGLGRAQAKAGIPALERMVTADGSKMVRVAAAFALQRLGHEAVPTLVAYLDDAKLAAQIGGYFMELGPSVAPALAQHLKDADAAIRGNVAVILGAVGTSAEVPALEPLLQDRNRDVVRAAQRAIERIKLRAS